MDNARWDDPRTEILGDADTLAFGSGRDRARRALPRWLPLALTFVVGTAAGSGAAYALRTGAEPEGRQPVPTTTTVNQEAFVPAQVRVGPFQPATDPADPKTTCRTSCGARLIRGSSAAGQLMSTVVLSNMGNVTVRYVMTSTWQTSSGAEVHRSTTRELSPGTISRVTIRVPVSRADVLADRALSAPQRCWTDVQLTGFYDDAFSS